MVKMKNYEVILEHNGYAKTLSSFRTKKLAQQYMEDNYEIIADWYEDRVEFSKFYSPKTRSYSYESTQTKANGEPLTMLMVRKLTK